jgi:hypothetical protein
MSNRTQRCPVCGLLLLWGIPPMMRCRRLSEASEIVCLLYQTWSCNPHSPCHVTNHIVDLRPSPSEQPRLDQR